MEPQLPLQLPPQLYIVVNHQQRLKVIFSHFDKLTTPVMAGGAWFNPFSWRRKTVRRNAQDKFDISKTRYQFSDRDEVAEPKDYMNACILMITFPIPGYVELKLVHEGEVAQEKKGKVYFSMSHPLAQGIMYKINDIPGGNPLHDLAQKNVQVCVVRHGSAAHNEKKKNWFKDWGERDTLLTNAGREQVQRAAYVLSKTLKDFQGQVTIFCSNLRRTMQTAIIFKYYLRNLSFARQEILIFPCIHELASNTTDRSLAASSVFDEFQRENVSLWKDTIGKPDFEERQKRIKDTVIENALPSWSIIDTSAFDPEQQQQPGPSTESWLKEQETILPKFISDLDFDDWFYENMYNCAVQCSNTTLFDLLVEYCEDVEINLKRKRLLEKFEKDSEYKKLNNIRGSLYACNSNPRQIHALLEAHKSEPGSKEEEEFRGVLMEKAQRKMIKQEAQRRTRFAVPWRRREGGRRKRRSRKT